MDATLCERGFHVRHSVRRKLCRELAQAIRAQAGQEVSQRKGDAFEKAVMRLWAKEQKNPWTLNDARFTMLVAKLLRRHHVKVRRMVKKMIQRMMEYEHDILNAKRSTHGKTDASIRGWAVKDLRDDILAALDRRAKGGKK